MLDLEEGKRAAARAAGLPFETVIEALDVFEPTDLSGAFRKVARRFEKLSRQAPRTWAENIELDRLDSALNFLLGEKGIAARAGRLLRLLAEAQRADVAVRGRAAGMSQIALSLEMAALALGEGGQAAQAARRLGRLLASLSRLLGRGWLRRRLFPAARAELAAIEIMDLLEEGDGIPPASAGLLDPCSVSATARADASEGALRLSAWLLALRVCEVCAKELQSLSACVRDSLAVESDPKTG